MAPVHGTGVAIAFDNLAGDGPGSILSQGVGAAVTSGFATVANAITLHTTAASGMYANLTTATAATIKCGPIEIITRTTRKHAIQTLLICNISTHINNT